MLHNYAYIDSILNIATMEISNSEFDENTKPSVSQTFEPELCASMDAPVCDGCCASNTNTDHTQDSYHLDKLFDPIDYTNRSCVACVIDEIENDTPSDDQNANDPTSELMTTEYLGVIIGDHPTPFADREKEISEIIYGCISAKDTPGAGIIDDDVCRIVTELAILGFTKRELHGTVLMKLKGELISLKEEGLFTDDTISLITNRLSTFLYKEDINYEEYKLYIKLLNDFSNIEDSADKVTDHRITLKIKELTEENQLSEDIVSGFETIKEKKGEIQKRLDQLKAINIPGIVETMKFIEEIGILSEVLVLKTKIIAVAISQLNKLVVDQQDRMRESINRIKKLNEEDEQPTVRVIICYNKRETKGPKRPDNKQPKSTVCRSEHHTPFCEKCGWRSSWVKAFKKRGVFIKEEANGVESNKHFWVNSVNGS